MESSEGGQDPVRIRTHRVRYTRAPRTDLTLAGLMDRRSRTLPAVPAPVDAHGIPCTRSVLYFLGSDGVGAFQPT